MARHEQDREDILKEATALVDRVELAVPGFAEPVVIGFRRQGSLSVYFGADPVYQFNTAGEFRRGYLAGRLVKAEHRRLWAMTRQRESHETVLCSVALSDDETAAVRHDLQQHLDRLLDELRSGQCRVLREVSDRGDVVTRVEQWLVQQTRPVPLAQRPHVSG